MVPKKNRYLLGAMRCSRFPMLCLCLLYGVCLSAQSLPNFNDAVDPANLDAADIFFQLDTVASHRRPLSLAGVGKEFGSREPLFVETFYQKSAEHQLLQLTKFTLPLDRLYAMVEGLGKTYFRISDGVCTIVLEYVNQDTKSGQSSFRKDCLL